LKKIICVDDSSAVLEGLESIFKGAGFSFESADCGEEGIRVIEKNQDCALLIVDLNMPDITGLEMIERLSEMGICSKVPKMMLTTEAITEDGNQEFLSTKGRELGIRLWFMKPVHEENKDHFLSVVQALLEEVA
tara:strand:- start:48 stop:449 length:402 start_codon:yes stop_codon:yes gene_type:complete